jgi:hypothetical protein
MSLATKIIYRKKKKKKLIWVETKTLFTIVF